MLQILANLLTFLSGALFGATLMCVIIGGKEKD